MLIEAILCGYKDIENRDYSLRGWVALQVSKTAVDDDMDRCVQHFIPDLPSSEHAVGTIVGAFFSRNACEDHTFARLADVERVASLESWGATRTRVLFPHSRLDLGAT